MFVRVRGRYAPSRVAPQEVYDPVPAEMQGQFFLFFRRKYENNFVDKTMVIEAYETESDEDGVLPQPFTIHYSPFTKTEKEKTSCQKTRSLTKFT
ncbi:MAG: hypothetical protein IJH07_03170 [Ruminococcus sp.]|nr:hypothetical protein [Ruminococcus sp.]